MAQFAAGVRSGTETTTGGDRPVADSLTITDNRTGKEYELPIMYGTYPEYGAAVPAKQLRQVTRKEQDHGHANRTRRVYGGDPDRKSTRLNSSHTDIYRMPSSA